MSFVERVPTWDRVGKEVTATGLENILKEAGLNFELKRSELKFGGSFGTKSRFDALVADYKDGSYPEFVSFVRPNYEVSQPIQSLSFLDEMETELSIERAGLHKNGLWLIARILEPVKIMGDDYFPYILVEDKIGKGKSDSVKACVSLLRMVCTNQFNPAFRTAPGVMNFKGKSSDDIDLASQADRLVNMTKGYINAFSQKAEEMAKIPVTDSYIESIVRDLCNIKLGKNASRKQEERVNAFYTAYNSPDNQNFRNTAFGVMNAFTDFSTHLVNNGGKSEEEWSSMQFVRNTLSNKHQTSMMSALENTHRCPICGFDREPAHDCDPEEKEKGLPEYTIEHIS